MTLNLTSTVTQQYRDLWKSCEIRHKHAREVDQLVDHIVAPFTWEASAEDALVFDKVLLKRMVARKLTKIQPTPTPPALR